MKEIEDIRTKLEKLKPVLKERFQVETMVFLVRMHVENNIKRVT